MNIPRKATEIKGGVLLIGEYGVDIRNFEFTLYGEITRSLVLEVLEGQGIKGIIDFDYDEMNTYTIN